MAFSKNTEFKYNIVGKSRIIEERGNQFIRFSKIAYGSTKPEEAKYDLRKWIVQPNGTEQMYKGVTFLSDNGPHELVNILVEEGFGNTSKILTSLKMRKDFKDAVNSINGTSDSDNGIDLKDIIG